MVTTSYHDLCKEIDILELRIKNLEAEYKMWYWKGCHGGMAPLDVCLERMKEICDQVELYVTLLDEKEKVKKQIEERMAEIDKIENRVAYMRDVEGKSLAEIAADLNYSYDWIKRLSARTSRRRGA